MLTTRKERYVYIGIAPNPKGGDICICIYMYGVLQTQREEIADYDALVNIKLQAQREDIYIYVYIYGLLQTQNKEMCITTVCSKPEGRRKRYKHKDIDIEHKLPNKEDHH